MDNYKKFCNLPLVFAYEALDDALLQLLPEDVFKSTNKEPDLHNLMKGSKSSLPWHNFNEMMQGKVARNKVAHKGVLLNKIDCLI